MKKILQWMISLAIVGLVLSSYAFLHNRGFASGSICTVNATINCDVVNKGPYSIFFGVPVALIGVVGYIFLLIGSIMKYRQFEDRTMSIFLFGLSYLGFGFSLYLTSIEATVLHAWCLICIASQLSMLVFAVMSTILVHHEEHLNPFLNWIKKFFHKI